MSVEAKGRPLSPPQDPNIGSAAELLNALRNGGNTRENRLSALVKIWGGELGPEVPDLVCLIERGWRILGEESGDSKNDSSVIIPDEELETSGIF